MSTKPITRDHEVTREFSIERPNRMAHIDRMYDFEPDPEPVTVTATDPATGEVVAHFFLDEQRVSTDLQPTHPPGHLLTAAALGLPSDAPGVIFVGPDDLTAVAGATEDDAAMVQAATTESPAFVFGVDFADAGLTVGSLLVFARELADSTAPVDAQVKAWTTDDGSVIRLAAVISP